MSASLELSGEVAVPRDLDHDAEGSSVASEPRTAAPNGAPQPTATPSDVAVRISGVTYTY
jgi:hypothetical protein